MYLGKNTEISLFDLLLANNLLSSLVAGRDVYKIHVRWNFRTFQRTLMLMAPIRQKKYKKCPKMTMPTPFFMFFLTDVKCISSVFKMKYRQLLCTVQCRLRYHLSPSTRIRISSNPQLFLSGYGYRPHEFDSESGKNKSALQSGKK